MTITFLLTLLSCDRLKRKGNSLVDKTKKTASKINEKIIDRKNKFVDKVFPNYDYDKADTENNKKRFKEHLQTDVTDDVKNIFAYGDFLGVDYKVLIGFTCDQTTIEKIITIKKMQLTTAKDDDGLIFLDEFKWWNKYKIELLDPYIVGKKTEYWQYLWYDKKTKQAFYEEFSL